MKKKALAFLFLGILSLTVFSSCKYYTEDPFIQSDKEAPQNDVIIYMNNETPDDDFYGLSTSDAVEKYGMLAISRDAYFENTFDGKYIYSAYGRTINDIFEMTLYKREYPNGNVLSPVCTDPLCTHTSDSGCQLAGLKNASVVCYGDNIFIVKQNDGELIMYDKKTNKSTLLMNKFSAGGLNLFNDTLYFTYNKMIWNAYESWWDIEVTRRITKISKDGEITEITRLDDYYNKNLWVYNDKYLLDYKSELYDGGNGRAVFYFRDIQTNEVTTAAEFDCPGVVQFAAVEPYMLYGSKLLLRYRYYTAMPNSLEDERFCVWIIDLQTKERRLLCTPDYYTHKRFNVCTFSSKCVVWDEPRFDLSDPIIMHVYFPYEDKELTYNLSDMIKTKTGDDNLPLSIICPGNTGSALILYDNDPNVMSNVYEVDLESGRVYKYDAPNA